jgi:hypothetical protein
MEIIIGFLRKIFDKEEGKLITFLKQNKFLTLIFLVIVAGIYLYIKFPKTFYNVGMYFLSNPVLTLGFTVFFLLWLLLLTYYFFTPRRALEGKEFREKFRFGLDKWEYYGDWRTEKENGENILIVTDSPIGGIAKPCQLWTDYVFEFETKIIQHNSSWIIRARDIFHYVMLQCRQTELYPHFWADGFWIYPEQVSFHLPFLLILGSVFA